MHAPHTASAPINLLHNPTIDSLTGGAATGAFLGGSLAILTGRRDKVGDWTAYGAVLGGSRAWPHS